MTEELTPLGFVTPVKEEFDGQPAPKLRDLSVAKRAVPKIVEILQRHAEPGDDMTEVAQELFDSHDYDGFSLGKKLHDDCWAVDAAFVEELDSVGSIVRACHLACRKDWVVQNKVTPAFSAGQSVLYNRSFQKPLPGTVERVYADEGRYVVNCPSEGHKPGAGYIVGFEEVSAT